MKKSCQTAILRTPLLLLVNLVNKRDLGIDFKNYAYIGTIRVNQLEERPDTAYLPGHAGLAHTHAVVVKVQ